MDRIEFMKKSMVGLGSIVALPTALVACDNDEQTIKVDDGTCSLSPSETKGPFPIKTPAELIRENIVSDRMGVALQIVFTIQNKNNNCEPIAGALVDVWHCDNEGKYSEYGGTPLQTTDYTGVHFLRGRNTTNTNGQVTFVSIYPGWYPGRAPHIHIEVLDSSGNSLLNTQVAFPESTSNEVYATSNYKGEADKSNASDNVFANSLEDQLATVTGNINDGYLLTHTIVVNG